MTHDYLLVVTLAISHMVLMTLAYAGDCKHPPGWYRHALALTFIVTVHMQPPRNCKRGGDPMRLTLDMQGDMEGGGRELRPASASHRPSDTPVDWTSISSDQPVRV